MTTVQDVASALHDWCPPSTAESYDNVGLQLGRTDQPVRRAHVALDLTPDVVAEAVAAKADVIVTHHPPVFKPLMTIRSDDFVGRMLIELAEARIAVLAAHTNLDVAANGVSRALADELGLVEMHFLQPSRDQSVKLSSFVPVESVDAVHAAMAAAGAGRIGAYDSCAFLTEGIGRFRPLAGAQPTVGQIGALETVEEIRLEMEVARPRLTAVLSAMKAAHPYEEVVFDIVDRENEATRTGMGMVGELRDPLPLHDFVALTSRNLEAAGVRFAGDPTDRVQRVAVCGGSGSSMIAAAIASGADAFVTGDISYHHFFQARDGNGPVIAIIDAGHYETERPAEVLIVREMGKRVPDVEWVRTALRTSPIHYHRT